MVKRNITLALPLFFASACAHPGDAGRRVIVAGYQFGSKATALIEAYDKRRQQEIVEQAKTKEEGAAALAKHRALAWQVVRLVKAYEALLAAGQPMMELLDAEKVDSTTVTKWFSDVASVGKLLTEAMIALGIVIEP